MFGDFFQLRPVRGDYAFENRLLWDLFQPVFLRENVRQNGDLSYVQLLNRARVGMLTPNNIKILKSRLHAEQSCQCSDKSLCIYPKRCDVINYNKACQQKLKSQLFSIEAQHYFSSTDSPPEYIKEDDRDAGNIPNILELSVGSRVMLLRNLDISQGLVNSAVGVVHDVDVSSSAKVERIYILFDDLPLSSTATPSTTQLVAIDPIEQTFVYAGRSIVRTNFPLSLSWSCTIYSQNTRWYC